MSKDLSSKLKNLCKAYNYTQDDVAAVLGVVRQTYSHYETGKRKPDIDTLFLLVGLYNISVDEFTTIDSEKEGFTSRESDLFDMIDYLNHPFNIKKLRYLTNIEKELIYYFEQLSERDKRDMVEFCKIKSR